MERTILHCDLNSFFASVEGLSRPDLKDKPFAVCGDPKTRHGIILAKNEIAKKAGVNTAETIWQAKRKCPELVLLKSHHELYKKYSIIVNEIYRQYTDLVEPFGIDESWLDVTNSFLRFGSGKKIADELRSRIKKETGLTISVGVSFCKSIAKLGSDLKKPDATTVILRKDFEKIVWPLPVSYLLYVGNNINTKLTKCGISTIGDLAKYDVSALEKNLGKAGLMLYEYAAGNDNSPVSRFDEVREVKSIGNGTTMIKDAYCMADLNTTVEKIGEHVAFRMQKHNLKARTLRITIKSSDFKSITRSKTFDSYIENSRKIAELAKKLIIENWDFKNPVRQITITVENLENRDNSYQLFIEDGDDKKTKKLNSLDYAVSDIREKFGTSSLQKACMISSKTLDITDDEEP